MRGLLIALSLVLAVAVVIGLRPSPPAPDASALAPAAAGGHAAAAAPSVLPSGPTRPPYNPTAAKRQHALWLQRLARAESSLAAYRESTRYPPTSQPLRSRPDRAYPNRPVTEEHLLGPPGGAGGGRVKLVTSQERIFLQGDESVLFTASLRDEAGAAVPLRVLRASAREVPPPNLGSIYPVVPLNLNDDGVDGDSAGGDGTFSVRLQPATQGFAGLFGQIRADVVLQHADQQAQTYFDVFYSPEAPASWQGPVRESLQDGSLRFDLPVIVKEAGRYVVSGRVDDANGVPLALLTFNEEVPAGPQVFTLTLFGKLVRDSRPAFPLTLRDVDAFLLRPDAFPDRRLMPRLPGPVHASQAYEIERFSDAQWNGEERARYLEELGRDVQAAKAQVRKFANGP